MVSDLALVPTFLVKHAKKGTVRKGRGGWTWIVAAAIRVGTEAMTGPNELVETNPRRNMRLGCENRPDSETFEGYELDSLSFVFARS